MFDVVERRRKEIGQESRVILYAVEKGARACNPSSPFISP
jgi:hypothetical protein